MQRAPVLACVILALAVPVAAETPLARPVMVGGHGELDACPSMGAIVPLRKGGDGFVAVRAAPSRNARELDRLQSGHQLLLCEDSADGRWVGVVYAEPQGGAQIGDCRVSSPLGETPVAYAGPCLSGWVARRYVTVTAG